MTQLLKISLPDGSVREVPQGSTLPILLPRLAPALPRQRLPRG